MTTSRGCETIEMQPQHGQFPLPGEVELGRRSPSPLPLSRGRERGFRSVLASFQDAAHHPLQVGFYLLVAHPQHPVAIVSHPLAQPNPQDLLGGCHPLSQLFGALAGFVEALDAWHISISCLNYRADL
jgi:hypothetical protein